MKNKIQEVLAIWHAHFSHAENQYSEFESSDIEYFVGCMLYNHFAFSKALENLKTMDLSYDFLSACAVSDSEEVLLGCGSEYDAIKEIIDSIVLEDELQKLEFLQSYIEESKSKYSGDALYLLNRLEYHVNSMAERYAKGVDAQRVDFINPLYR